MVEENQIREQKVFSSSYLNQIYLDVPRKQKIFLNMRMLITLLVKIVFILRVAVEFLYQKK